jgi:hypothetical protein
MTNQQTPFDDGWIDHDLDRRLPVDESDLQAELSTTAPDARLLADLRRAHQSHEEDAQSLTRVYARLQAHKSGASRVSTSHPSRKGWHWMNPGTESRPPVPTGTAHRSRWPYLTTGIGVVLAALIVGALAAVFLTAAPGRHGGPATHSSPTVTHGRWVSLDLLAASVEFDANDVPAISPSDPRVVYESHARGIQQHLPATLRRTDDGGATWHDLPVPVPAAHVGVAGFLVSPLDARNVFLTLIDTQAEDCPAGTAQLNTEGAGVLCWLQYTSVDGGAQWRATKLPGSGWITPNLTNNSATALQVAQGSDGRPQLYALLQRPGATSWARLIVSADRGLSWRYADVPLLAAGERNACFTAADPQNATVYAVTTADAECVWYSQLPLTLWRSNDAGAHWTNLGPLATPNLRGLRVAHDTTTGHSLLYAAVPRTTQMVTNKVGAKVPQFSADPSDLKVSADGGVTWTSAPSAGIPASVKPLYDIGLLGVLSDGSVIIGCMSQTPQEGGSLGVLYAWKSGAATWRQLAPPPDADTEVRALTTVASASTSAGADTLYLVVSYLYAPGPGAYPTFTFFRYDP